MPYYPPSSMTKLEFLERLRRSAQDIRDEIPPERINDLPQEQRPNINKGEGLPSSHGVSPTERPRLPEHLLANVFAKLSNQGSTLDIRNAFALQNDVARVISQLEQLSPNADEDQIQSSLINAEKTVREIIRNCRAIREAEALKVVEEVGQSALKASGMVREWRGKHPDTSPLEIDNTTAAMAIDPFSEQHVSTLVAYTMALAHRVLDRAGRSASSLVLKGFKLFGQALLDLGTSNDMQCKAVEDISIDIRTIERRFNLDIKTVPYAVCPNCSHTHEPIYQEGIESQPTYPEICAQSSLRGGQPCGGVLLCDGQPVRVYEYYPFFDWLARFIALPGIAKYGRKEEWEGEFFRSFKGADGKLFVANRGDEGRWFFALFGDSFNIEMNKHGGKTSSTGVLALFCLNLPLAIRNDPAHVYVAGIIEGPHEPRTTEAEHRHYLRPLVTDLEIGYTRGVRFSSTNFAVERIALADGFMDFKAARPHFGFMDINAHAFCHCCGLWHRVNHLRTDHETWSNVDDNIFREGANAWMNATTEKQRDSITARYGLRYSELWRLAYWKPSLQVVVDPMHTIYLILGQRFVREGLGLELTENEVKKQKRRKGQKTKAKGNADQTEAYIAFHYNFTPPPPLQSLRRGPLSGLPNMTEDIRLATLDWDHLAEPASAWRQRILVQLRDNLSQDDDAPAHVAFIRRNLSTFPTTHAEAKTLVSKLAGKKWPALLFVCTDLMAFPSGKVGQLEVKPHIPSYQDINRNEMANALVEWRSEKVESVTFIWPHFALKEGMRPKAPWATTEGGPEDSEDFITLFSPERSERMRKLATVMTRSAAVSIGNIQQYLCQPRTPADLTAQLIDCHLQALEYVCVDINRLPSGTLNQVTITRQLVKWRSTMPQKPLLRTEVDSVEVLLRLQQVVRETVVPSRFDKPPSNLGFPAAGTLKASQWRSILELYLPLALLSLWRVESPVSADDAVDMAGVLNTSIHLCCAAINMAKRNLTPERQRMFLDQLRMHVDGLKEEFPGLSFPSIHMAFHIAKYMEQFGNVRNFWCFPGERLIRMLQNIPVNHKEGETERTLLHSFARTSNFRRWLLRPNCPPLLRKCYDWLEDTYRHRLGPPNPMGTDQINTLKDGDSDVDDSENFGREQLHSVPRKLARLFGAKEPLPSKLMSRLKVSSDDREVYSVSSVAGEGNSYICFHPEGKKAVEWVAGKIEYIFEHKGSAKMAIRRSKEAAGSAVDPFRTFWAEGFQAKLISPDFGRLEIIEVDWIVGHAARWRLTKDLSVVVDLSKD